MSVDYLGAVISDMELESTHHQIPPPSLDYLLPLFQIGKRTVESDQTHNFASQTFLLEVFQLAWLDVAGP